MALTSMPYLTIQELDGNGNPLVGAKLFFYAAGTSTKQDTYADANSVTKNANPVVLDSAGRATVFLLPLTYDIVFAPSTDSDPPVSPYWTRSGILPVPVSSGDLDVNGTAGESLAAGQAVYLSDGSGGKTAGKWYLADADFTYASSLAADIGMTQDAIASGASGSIRKGGRVTSLSGLNPGTLYFISATAGALTSSAPANCMPIAVADSTTSVLLQPPTPWASSTVPGLVSTGSQTWTGTKTLDCAPNFTTFPTGIGSFVTSYAASNTTKNNNTTYVDVTGLSFAVLANKNYAFTIVLHVVTNATAGIKVTLTGPAAPTALRWGLQPGSLGTSSPTSQSTFSANCPFFPSASASGSDFMLTLSGQLRNGANAGTVQLQFAQQVGDASNTIVYAESSVIAYRIS